MARARKKAGNLSKLLDSAAAPVYVVDEERHIVFCNAACAAWLGVPADDLVGEQCHYHPPDEATPVAAALAVLCPPPDVMSGTRRFAVLSGLGADGQTRQRRVEFQPLGNALAGYAPILAILDGEDLPAGWTEPTIESEAERLHAELLGYRRQFAARYRVDRLVGNSPAMRRVRSQLKLAASDTAPVMITGPEGSGRNYVAKAIHYYRGDPLAALAPLDCAILGAELLQSTLASLATKTTTRGGAAPQATLLLNQVDQMPAESQELLARLLDGAALPVRLITTAETRLKNAVDAGAFRADLAYALSSLVIEMPPLAERLQDLPLVAQMFVEEINARGGRQIAGLTPETLDRLALHVWTRNLDELAEIIAAAHSQAQGTMITVADLPDRMRLAADAARHARKPLEPINLNEHVARLEREMIERALKQARGNKSQAAPLLGLTRASLLRRMAQLGMAGAE